MMRWLVCLAMVACRIGFDEVGTDASAAATIGPVCNGTVCAATCPAGTRCEIDCAGSSECAVECDGTCTVTHCQVGHCVVQCSDALAHRIGDTASCE